MQISIRACIYFAERIGLVNSKVSFPGVRRYVSPPVLDFLGERLDIWQAESSMAPTGLPKIARGESA